MMKFFEWLNERQLAWRNAYHGLLSSYITSAFWVPIYAAIACVVIGTGVLHAFGPAVFRQWLPIIAVGSLLFIGVRTYIDLGREYQHRDARKRHRGRLMLKEKAARKEARKKRKPGDRGILWGKLRLPSKDAEKHFCIIGGIGSGKTLTLRMLMQDQLPLLTPGSNRRALIYDCQEDFVQTTAAIMRDIDCPMYILNPFDKRRAAWDIAKDIDYAPVAANLAARVFPSNPKSHNKFYEETPRTIMTCVVEVFIARANHKWTLRHLVLVMQSKALINLITDLSPQARATMKLTFEGSDKSLGDVMSTINSTLYPWGRIAASWEGVKKEKRISIADWLAGTSILVLPRFGQGDSETLRIYSLFIDTIATNLSTLEGGDSSRRTWLFLDEFPELGNIEGLKKLITLGRNKGFTCVLGLQQPVLVYAAYGREIGEVIISECGIKAYLKASSDDAAKWVSNSISDFSPDWDESYDKSRTGHLYPPRYFVNLPDAGYENGVYGVYLAPSITGWEAHYTPAELNALLCKPDKDVDRLQRLEDEFLNLEPWGKEDSELFGIPWPIDGVQPENTQPSPDPNPPADDDPLADMIPVGRI